MDLTGLSREAVYGKGAEILRALVQAADSVIVTDPDGIVEYVNPGFERTTGYSREEVVGGGTHFLRSKEHSEGFYASIERTISRGTVWSGRLVSCRKDGALFECDTTISPVQNEAGGSSITYG